ncbi:MAG: glycosyltransferase family 2 protein [Anaerolineae bacterium]
MEEHTVSLGIVTVSYNTRDLLQRCLEAVQGSLERSSLAAQVVVVDNASRDGSAELVRERFSWVQLFANERNDGFAAASNQGLRALGWPEAGPGLALLLNPDTVVQGMALAELVSFMHAEPRAGAAGARLVYEDGRFQHSAFRFPTLPMAFFDFFQPHHRLLDSALNGRYPRRLYRRGAPFAIDHPLGAALMVRREAAVQVGLLDEGFFMYCEEIDWCRRLKKAGWRIYCVPRAEIVHYGAQSTQQSREAMFVALWRSRYRLFAKHEGRLYRFLVARIVAAGLAQEERRLRQAVEAGRLEPEAAVRRLAAFAEVRRLGREVAWPASQR